MANLAINTFRTLADVASPRVIDLSGDLVRTLENFAITMPHAGTNLYRPPSPQQANALAETWRMLVAGRIDDASRAADALQYDVVRYTDTPTQRTYNMLVERTSGLDAHLQLRHPLAGGWGLFIHDPSPDAVRGVALQLAHPSSDLNTGMIGAEVLRTSRADSMIVAGTARNAAPGGLADVAHRTDSAFHTISQEQAERGRLLVQIHGFNEARHPGYGQVVVSDGTLERPLLQVERIAAHLRSEGYEANVANGRAFENLAGRTNVQGQAARERGALFAHIEVGGSLRNDDRGAERSRFARALGRAIRQAVDA